MSCLYVVEHGTTISYSSNCVQVRSPEEECRDIPIETLENISVFCRAQITSQCIMECMKRGIAVSYYSSGGKYYGRLVALEHVHVGRQRRQAQLYHSEFALEFGKKVLRAKIKNQQALLRRYARNKECSIEEEMKMMNIFSRKIRESISVNQMMGYEGGAAKYYFQGLGKVIDDNFRFSGRSRHPSADEVNAMLNFGYAIVMNIIYGEIVKKGLNPYFGLIHSDRENHPTLASDLMEEWRPVIVDAVVMSLTNGHEIFPEHFQHDLEEEGYFLTREGKKIFIDKLEKKERTETKYLSYVNYPVSFRRSMELQVSGLVHAIEEKNVDLYQPVRNRLSDSHQIG